MQRVVGTDKSAEIHGTFSALAEALDFKKNGIIFLLERIKHSHSVEIDSNSLTLLSPEMEAD